MGSLYHALLLGQHVHHALAIVEELDGEACLIPLADFEEVPDVATLAHMGLPMLPAPERPTP